MEIKNVEVMNFEGAIRGMRNPLNSWAKSDSIFDIYCEHDDYGSECFDTVSRSWAEYQLENVTFATEEEYNKEFERIAEERRAWLWDQGATPIGIDHHYKLDLIGPADMDLCRRLISGGLEHRKYLRQIFVSLDITAPLYWWKEADTYAVGVTKNSTSTMHKLASTPITLECFETDDSTDFADIDEKLNPDTIIAYCETLRQKYLETKDKRYWKELIRWLPNGWLQTRTVTLNYEVLRNMYHQRKGHKLSEWRYVCKWIEELPYAQELIIG